MVRTTKTGRFVTRPKLQHLPPKPGGEVERALQEKYRESLTRPPIVDTNYAGIEMRIMAKLNENEAIEKPRGGLMKTLFDFFYGGRR